MKQYWYIEWLEIVNQCADGQGYLVLFDLAGDAAMSTSVNCAMELAILYRLFFLGDSGMQLVVLTDDDVVLDDSDALAKVVEEKSGAQEAQKELFKIAYQKCYAFLQSYFAETTGLHEIGQKWTREYKEAGGGPQGTKRLSIAVEAMDIHSVDVLLDGADSVLAHTTNPMLGDPTKQPSSKDIPVRSPFHGGTV
jgi:hypothetical protein